MEEMKSKVFARLSENGCILTVDGGYTESNITDPENWVLIDEGAGDKYNLCQTAYFPNGYLTDDGIPLYKWDGKQVIPRTEAEIQADRDALPPPLPTSEERLRSDTDYLSMMTGIVLPSESAVSMALDLTYSSNFDKVKHYYEVGLWNTEMIQTAVAKWLTQEEVNEILNKV